ncbi:D-alanine--D-alanine ligase [Tuberibacillus sp. Marseille-P3662]|uniref:D-alanine--D-alanine ligase n=1 Tax=Tuberibacillus sp. Marseille-P3662 TaxID=1965358 RepID=UPI000A1CB84E|nr:D-alanine--D-alanine ligase [Tuberibacillus sp. Marseille-P3662]
MSTRPTVAILYGGKSAEHDVSMQTAFSVINAIDKEQYQVLPIHITNHGRWIEGHEVQGELSHKSQLLLEENQQGGFQNKWLTPAGIHGAQSKPDIIFPLLHGPNGEDGTVQGFMELLDMAYVGSGVSGSAVAMDKVLMHDLFKAHGLKQANYVHTTAYAWKHKSAAFIESVKGDVGFPCFVKPANYGSSIGISECADEAELISAVQLALQFDQKVIVEEKIDGREIEIGVIGNDELDVSVPGEIQTSGQFYDYQAKYEDGNSTLVIPADLSENVHQDLVNLAKRAFHILNAQGLARVDVFVRNDEIYINEINTMPGFTPYSMFPLLWDHTGVSYGELINRLLRYGLQRHQSRQDIRHLIE